MVKSFTSWIFRHIKNNQKLYILPSPYCYRFWLVQSFWSNKNNNNINNWNNNKKNNTTTTTTNNKLLL